MYEAKKIVFYDPFGGKREIVTEFFANIRSYLKAKADMEGWDASTVDAWKEEFLCIPRQPNDNSCGVFICMMAQTFCDKCEFQFDMVSVSNLRQVIMRNLLKCDEIMGRYRIKKGLGDSNGFQNTPTSQEKFISTTAYKESDGLPGSNQRDSASPTAQSSPERGTRYHFQKHTAQSDLGEATMGPGDKTTDDAKKKKKLRPRSKIKRPYKSAEWELPPKLKAVKRQTVKSSDAEELDMEEAWKKQAETMVSQLDKLGQLKSIIDQACQEGEKMPSDFGRGGKEGMATFIKVMEGKGDGVPGEPSIQQSLKSLLSASEGITSALEQELVRRFPLQLRWNRKEEGLGTTIKTLANRMAFAIGEILRRFEQGSL